MNKPIEIFVRHCNSSANSVGKSRPEWFSREKCWENLLNTSSPGLANITAIFDGHPDKNHFIKKEQDRYFKLVELEGGGDDARSFLNLLNYVKSLNLDDETIIYFVEDDYIHISNWDTILIDVFNCINVDYVSLFDHGDKYFLPMYEGLQSAIYTTTFSHWRTTPSCCNTYAFKYKTLIEHFDIHVKYCDLKENWTRDHEKFVELWKNGSNLISPIPSISTHCETETLAPIVKWDKILKEI